MYVDEVIMKCYQKLYDSEVLSLSKHAVMKRFANTLNLKALQQYCFCCYFCSSEVSRFVSVRAK